MQAANINKYCSRQCGTMQCRFKGFKKAACRGVISPQHEQTEHVPETSSTPATCFLGFRTIAAKEVQTQNVLSRFKLYARVLHVTQDADSRQL